MNGSRWSEEIFEDDDLYNSDEEIDDDSSIELLPCPECGEMIYEEAEQCPACGRYVLRHSHQWLGRPWWWLVLGILGIGATILALSL